MNLIIRTESPGDYNGITSVNDLAFGQENEGVMIINLRENPSFIEELSLVADADGTVVGHILFFPVEIQDGKKRHGSVSLAPMAVHPDFQNRGIGGELVRFGLDRCREQGFDSVVLLGHPEYYPRFGFKKASRWKIFPPMEVPDEASMAMELVRGGLSGVSGTIRYPVEYGVAL